MSHSSPAPNPLHQDVDPTAQSGLPGFHPRPAADTSSKNPPSTKAGPDWRVPALPPEPDWRWSSVCDAAFEPGSSLLPVSDRLTSAAVRYLRDVSGDRHRDATTEQHPAIAAAHHIYERDDATRWVLEA